MAVAASSVTYFGLHEAISMYDHIIIHGSKAYGCNGHDGDWWALLDSELLNDLPDTVKEGKAAADTFVRYMIDAGAPEKDVRETFNALHDCDHEFFYSDGCPTKTLAELEKAFRAFNAKEGVSPELNIPIDDLGLTTNPQAVGTDPDPEGELTKRQQRNKARKERKRREREAQTKVAAAIGLQPATLQSLPPKLNPPTQQPKTPTATGTQVKATEQPHRTEGAGQKFLPTKLSPAAETKERHEGGERKTEQKTPPHHHHKRRSHGGGGGGRRRGGRGGRGHH